MILEYLNIILGLMIVIDDFISYILQILLIIIYIKE